MALYVDDALVGTNGVDTNQGYGGYWRVGGDNLGAGRTSRPATTSPATMDEVALYATR